MSNGNAPLKVLHQQGRQALRSGNLPQALTLLQQAALKTSARENDYLPVLEDWRDVLTRLGHHRHALTINWYRSDSQAEASLLDKVPPIDRARTLQAWAERDEGSSGAAERYNSAADIYEAAGLIAHAALCREKAKDHPAARALWSRLAQALSQTGGDRYAAGLARFNVARACEKAGDEAATRAAIVASVHQLEEAADRYERIGLRERAFDCYQVLIAVGKRSGEFEHVLEGYVNVVRILREDNLRYYALQSYEDALAAAEQNAEYSAGATLAKEMASYAAAEGLSSVSNHATRLGAEMWQQVARAAIERGGPAEMAENAMLAAIVAFARQGQFHDVGRLYTALTGLELEQARKVHYQRAARRYEGVENSKVDASPLPSHLRQDAAFPDVWHVDLIEWEQHGSAAAACGDIVLEPGNWSEVTRRRAMIARMQALDIEASEGQPNQATLVRLAELLGQVELYTILAPLERLYEHPAATVRHAVAHALERFMYKRSFVTVRAALSDADAAVRKRAYQTLEALRFPHAYDPLARIFRESNDKSARAAAIRAIARIDTNEAAELLLGVFQHEGNVERTAASEALKHSRGKVFIQVARSAMPGMADAARKQLADVLHARGEVV
jgi:tetratricopeptide (TPR) repeat protein